MLLRHSRDYAILFAVMAIAGLILEGGLYGWVFGYQPRWLTILLGVVEFLIVKWIVEWPYPLEIRLHTRQALELYAPAWLLGWLTIQTALPSLFPRWAEDGGEFLRVGSPAVGGSLELATIAQRRRAYLLALGTLGIIALPWLAATLVAPAHSHFTGLLWLERLHWAALAQATLASQSGSIFSPAGAIGWIARAGHWQVINVYWIASSLTAFACLLGIQIWHGLGQPSRNVLGYAALAVLLLPFSWLVTLLLGLMPITLLCRTIGWRWPRPMVNRKSAWFAAGLIWLLVWVRVPSAEHAYIEAGPWQAITWLYQFSQPNILIWSEPRYQPWIEALAGKPVVTAQSEADFWLMSGADCDDFDATFRHSSTCIVDRSSLGPATR